MSPRRRRKLQTGTSCHSPRYHSQQSTPRTHRTRRNAERREPSAPTSPRSPRAAQHSGASARSRQSRPRVKHVGGSAPPTGSSTYSQIQIGGKILRRENHHDHNHNPNGKSGAGSAAFVWNLLQRLSEQQDNKGNVELFGVLDVDGSGKTDAEEIMNSLEFRRGIILDEDEREVPLILEPNPNLQSGRQLPDSTTTTTLIRRFS